MKETTKDAHQTPRSEGEHASCDSRLLEGAHAIPHNLGIGEMMIRSTYPLSYFKGTMRLKE
jgi:hypothetical protein